MESYSELSNKAKRQQRLATAVSVLTSVAVVWSAIALTVIARRT